MIYFFRVPKGKGSRRLVIDASVARASGGVNAVNPISKHCRDFLAAVCDICHRFVLTPEIKREWNKHQSAFAMSWRVSMMARKKVEWVRQPTNEVLRVKVREVCARDKEKEATAKDIILIEAALATDSLVSSLDETVRSLFHTASVKVSELRGIVWVNPTKRHEEVLSWLQSGAKNEKSRLLASPPEEAE